MRASVVRHGKEYALDTSHARTATVSYKEVDTATAKRGPNVPLATFEGTGAQVKGLVAWMYVTALVKR